MAGLVSLLLAERPTLTPAAIESAPDHGPRLPGGQHLHSGQLRPGIADAFAVSALDVELVAPALVAPADGTTVATGTPQLVWSAVDGADAYQVQVSENAGFSAVIINEPSVAGTTATVTLPGDGAGGACGPRPERTMGRGAKSGSLRWPWVNDTRRAGSQYAARRQTNNLRPKFTWSASASATE